MFFTSTLGTFLVSLSSIKLELSSTCLLPFSFSYHMQMAHCLFQLFISYSNTNLHSHISPWMSALSFQCAFWMERLLASHLLFRNILIPYRYKNYLIVSSTESNTQGFIHLNVKYLRVNYFPFILPLYFI